MTTSQKNTGRVQIVSHGFEAAPSVGNAAPECAHKGCYAPLRNHPEYVTAVYNVLYLNAVRTLPGTDSVGRFVACHTVAQAKVARMFRMPATR